MAIGQTPGTKYILTFLNQLFDEILGLTTRVRLLDIDIVDRLLLRIRILWWCRHSEASGRRDQSESEMELNQIEAVRSV